MATVTEHYNNLLANIYSWMFGGFEAGIQRNTAFFEKQNLTPRSTGIALDLGAGCGFQSIPLARSGYTVTALDLDRQLLDELEENAGELDIKTVQGDLLDFEQTLNQNIELVVCMTDTLLHLDSKEDVEHLCKKVQAALAPEGTFIITFRDLTTELSGLDRFLPVRNDEHTILSCFLEYEPDTVKVHDIVYQKNGENWELSKSFYRKLRLSGEWLKNKLSECGFTTVEIASENGLTTVRASR